MQADNKNKNKDLRPDRNLGVLMLNKQFMAAFAACLMTGFAQAELKQLDDASLSNVTGQSGVEINISVKGEGINVEQVKYTDDASGGVLLLQNTTIKNINNMRQTIRIEKGGVVAVKAGSVDGIFLSMGDDPAIDANNYSAVVLSNKDGTRQSELIDSLALTLDLGESDIRLYAKPSTEVLRSAGVTGFYNENDPQMLINIKSGLEVKNLDAQVLGFTQGAAERKVRAENQLAANTPLTKAQQERVNRLADGGALTIKGLKFYGKDSSGVFAVGNKIELAQTVWMKDSKIFLKSAALSGQLEIDSIGAGQNRLGSLKVENINLSPMLMKVYSH